MKGGWPNERTAIVVGRSLLIAQQRSYMGERTRSCSSEREISPLSSFFPSLAAHGEYAVCTFIHIYTQRRERTLSQTDEEKAKKGT